MEGFDFRESVCERMVCACVCVNNSNKALGESGEKGEARGAQKNEPRAHDSFFWSFRLR